MKAALRHEMLTQDILQIHIYQIMSHNLSTVKKLEEQARLEAEADAKVQWEHRHAAELKEQAQVRQGSVKFS
jgi:hypothetical protein